MRAPDEQTVIQRAIQLASSGEYSSITELKARLRSERFEGVDAHFVGLSTRRKFKTLIRKALEPSPPPAKMGKKCKAALMGMTSEQYQELAAVDRTAA